MTEAVDRDGRGLLDHTAYEYDTSGRLAFERTTHAHDGRAEERIRYRYGPGTMTREVELDGVWQDAGAAPAREAWPPSARPEVEALDVDGDGKIDQRTLSTFDARRNLVRETVVDLRSGESQEATFGYDCYESARALTSAYQAKGSR